MKLFKVNVLTMRCYLLQNHIIIAESENEVRTIVWTFLAKNGYLNKELFYKVVVWEVNVYKR